MKRAALAALALLIAAWLPARAAAGEPLILSGPAVQGSLLIGETLPGAAVDVDGTALTVSPAGHFLVGFDRDAGPRARLTVRLPSGRTITRRLAVAQRSYEISRVDGLPQRTVTPDPAALERIRDDNARIAAVRRTVGDGSGFLGGFVRPAEGRISGVFGSQRVLNGEPRRPHYGLDIAAPEGTPVVAAADGVVALAETDMFLTGRTVMFDHGLGLTSVYIHLSAIAVRPGQPVKRGQRVGAIGMSGRATGPHLHWGVTLLTTHLDPALLIDAE